MLQLLSGLAEGGDFFNLFRYITFRASGAMVTALLLGFLFGQPMINLLRKRQKNGQPIREEGPENHKTEKAGTPTMGGILILGAVVTSTLLWAKLDNAYIWIVLFVTLGFGALGAVDDFKKVSSGTSKGLSVRTRFGVGLVIAAIASAAAMMAHPPELAAALAFPVFKDILLDLGVFFVPFAVIVIVGSANAVNLTDGLDGLAVMPVMIAASALGIIAYAVGRVDFTDYLDVHYVPGTGELLVFSAGLVGGGLGFLWYNAPPAAVFMGDTGSLALGGAVGSIAVATKHELVLVIIGGLFVVEALSVIIQVFYFKTTGKRVFLMAPIHHHFEKRGWAEAQIVIRFWIIALILALAGLATLKCGDVITLTGVAGRRIAVLGLGRTGLAACQSLTGSGATVLAWDDAADARDAAARSGIALFDLNDPNVWKSVASLIVSPGIPHLYPAPNPIVAAASRAGVPLDNDIGLFLRTTRDSKTAPAVIAVTGSNGKSTTSALMESIFLSAGRKSRVARQYRPCGAWAGRARKGRICRA